MTLVVALAECLSRVQSSFRHIAENVEKLLEEGGSSMDDVMEMLVYLRDMADYETVRALFDERFPRTPKVFLLAPVCRPTWLIEMECVALKSESNSAYRDF